MSLTSVLAKHLDIAQRESIAATLASQLSDSPQVLEPLLDLVSDSESSSPAYSTLKDYVHQLTFDRSSRSSETWSRISKICSHFPNIHDSLISDITAKLQSYLQSVQPGQHRDSSVSLEISCDQETALGLFKLLEVMLRHNSNAPYGALDLVLLQLIRASAYEISASALDAMRWRIAFVRDEKLTDTMWVTIFDLLEAEKNTAKMHGYLLWLRYLGGHPSLASDDKFQIAMQQTKYWKYIQLGLGSTSHKLRKYALSILQLSVGAISSNIQTDLFSWTVKDSHVHMEDWKRFVTLFEILGVDTSLHQADAATSDLSRLISTQSRIHPSWGFCLLSTGFKASTDSIQKLSMSLLMSICPENLHLIKHGLDHFRDIFLPFMMNASHFMVRNIHGKDQCEYGAALSRFLCCMLQSMDSDMDASDFALAILLVLQRFPDCFDPARIYVLHGLVTGLDTRKVILPTVHGSALKSLIENRSEGDVYQGCNTLLCLRILCLVEWDTFNSMNKYYTQFIRRHGYGAIRDNIECVTSSLGPDVTVDDNTASWEVQALAAKALNHGFLSAVDARNDHTRAMLLASGLFDLEENRQLIKNTYQSLLGAIVSGGVDDDVVSIMKDWQYLKDSQTAFSFDITGFWTLIEEGVLSDDIEVLRVTLDRYCLFNNVLAGCAELFDIERLSAFENSLLKNAQNLSKSVKDFYKTRELFNAEFYTTLAILAPLGLTEKIGWDLIMSWLTCNSSNFKGNFAMVKLLNYYVNNGHATENTLSCIEDIVTFLADLWEHLASTRLQLNQKPLHLLIIDTILSPSIISASCGSEVISNAVKRTLLSVIHNAHTRRSLAPELMKMIESYRRTGSDLGLVPWLPEILVQIALITTPKTNMYRLEPVMGELHRQIRSTWDCPETDYENAFSECDIYAKVHGVPEVAAKVILFGLLKTKGVASLAQRVIDFISENDHDYQLINIQNPTDGHEEWKRIQLLSIILACSSQVNLEIEKFIGILGTETSPLARVYVEWIVSLTCLTRKQYIRSLLEFLRGTLDMKALLHISYQRCLYLVAQQLPPDEGTALLLELLPVVIAGATSSKAIIRHSSLSLAVAARDEMRKKNHFPDPTFAKTVETIYDQTVATNSFVQFKNGDALLWDIVGDCTLVGITGGVLKRVCERSDIDFIGEDEYYQYLPDILLRELGDQVGNNCENLWVGETINTRGTVSRTGESQQPLQTKSGAWNVMIDPDVSDVKRSVTRSDLIVVSSLVSKAPNLGGICRLCDVLGAGLLTLGDIKAKNSTQFKSVAVTADQWMPMIQVTPNDVRDYLLQKKREGYTLIGLEQTDKSVELNGSLKFPKKTLILLGREKEGIPGDLLAELDTCVEIKQVGIIRSMNIQTATAVIVHAYASQHC